MNRYYLLLFIFIFCGCSQGNLLEEIDNIDLPETVEEGDMMPVRIFIPSTELFTRVTGDPGSTENFSLPRFLYLWMVHTKSGVETVIYRTHELDPANWELLLPSVNGDYIYEYTGDIGVRMPVDREGATCEAYVAVSRVALSNISSSLSTLAEVRSATFDLPSPELGDSYNSIIRDIYSSPYNLTTTSGSDTYYYGKVQDYTSSQPYVNLILYHVGAKLDLNWNIDEGNRSTLWLQHESDAISVTGLKCKNCYLFKPMQNDAVGADPYTWNISANIGNQWLGREYAYVIPYFNGSSQYPISATVKKVVNSSNGTKTTAMNIEVAGYASYVFTPWLIGKITVDNTTAP